MREFAEKVERLCEFLLDRMEGSEERETIIRLKEEAADLQVDRDPGIFDGLTAHMRGMPPKEEQT